MRVRDTLTALVVAGALVAAACGDDDDTAGGGGDGGDFCDQAGDLYQDMVASADFDRERFDDLLGAMDDLDPPEAVADDWEATIDAMNTLAERVDVEAPDVEDPDTAAALEQAVGAFDRIGTYLTDECGLDLSG